MTPSLHSGHNFIYNTTSNYENTLNKKVGSQERYTIFKIQNVHSKIYVGHTESHEQLFLHATWEQQTKESTMVGATSCCVNPECLVTSIACIM
jgi:hypothetical protein